MGLWVGVRRGALGRIRGLPGPVYTVYTSESPCSPAKRFFGGGRGGRTP